MDHDIGLAVVLTTHELEDAERLADDVVIIDHGRLIASGTPLELTRGGVAATIRLVVTRPFPPGSPDSLRAALGERTEVTQLDERSLLVTGPADASTLAKVSRWCEENDVLPESLTLGQRNLEDVFLQLTGRGLTPCPLLPRVSPPGRSPRVRAAPRGPARWPPRPRWSRS